MHFEQIYKNQVELLIEVLPVINQVDSFALKGGTAINLFLQDMPRLSVDIDLTWLPIEPRDQFMMNIEAALIKMKMLLDNNRLIVKESRNKAGTLIKLFVHKNNAMIKIEPNFTLRGSVFAAEDRDLCPKAQEIFLKYVQVKTMSEGDIYGGKICAALDRHHPRDLFDVKLLMETKGLNTQIRQAFIIYLASSNRPMHELLTPSETTSNFKSDFQRLFERDFAGMTALPVTWQELLPIRSDLISQLLDDFDEQERQFLLSIKSGEPEWSLLPMLDVQHLPGIQWKLQNINKMEKGKRQQMQELLKGVLQI